MATREVETRELEVLGSPFGYLCHFDLKLFLSIRAMYDLPPHSRAFRSRACILLHLIGCLPEVQSKSRPVNLVYVVYDTPML